MGLETRFWEKVQREGQDECWLWTAARHPDGYGKIKVDGRMEPAHRVAYGLEVETPGDAHVLHTCDNPPCVNPDHLYLGDPSDNMQDAWDRGRKDHDGEKNPSAKLTRDQAEKIRRKYDGEDLSQQQLGEEFGVAQPTVSRIVRGVSFVDGE